MNVMAEVQGMAMAAREAGRSVHAIRLASDVWAKFFAEFALRLGSASPGSDDRVHLHIAGVAVPVVEDRSLIAGRIVFLDNDPANATTWIDEYATSKRPSGEMPP